MAIRRRPARQLQAHCPRILDAGAGLIFLRPASNCFNANLPDITVGIDPKLPASRREALIKLGFQGKAAINLPETSRFEHIASLPTGANVGEALDPD